MNEEPKGYVQYMPKTGGALQLIALVDIIMIGELGNNVNVIVSCQGQILYTTTPVRELQLQAANISLAPELPDEERVGYTPLRRCIFFSRVVDQLPLEVALGILPSWPSEDPNLWH